MEQELTPVLPRFGRRLAAVMAVVAPIVAVVVSLEVAVRHPGHLAVLLLSIAVGTLSAWYVLTRRGILRIVAVVFAVTAVAAVIMVSLSVLLAQVALLVVFLATGRYALGAEAEALFEAGCRAHRVGAARHGVLIVNPNSGAGKATRLNLLAESRRRGIEPMMLRPGDDLSMLAERAVADGADVLGMAGGDGSQALVAAVATRHDVAYVCIPSGTRNHFALDLGLDRDDVVAALDAFTDGVERTVDLGQVNGRVFVNNASLGLYALVVRSGAYRGAKARTWGRMLPDLLGPAAAPSDLEFDGPDGHRHRGMPLVLVSNNPYRLTRAARSGGRPRLDTGRLGIVAARGPVTPRPTAWPGRFGELMEWSRTDFEVRATAPVPIGLDGETSVLEPPLRFRSLPGALRVRLPRHAQGAQRARRNASLTRRDLTALVRIASGRPSAPRVARADVVPGRPSSPMGPAGGPAA
jgi:diacylglycerol kinase family enzyme